jgi:hypothetical protein
MRSNDAPYLFGQIQSAIDLILRFGRALYVSRSPHTDHYSPDPTESLPGVGAFPQMD